MDVTKSTITKVGATKEREKKIKLNVAAKYSKLFYASE